MISCKIIGAYRLLLQKRFQRNVRKQNSTDLKFGSTLHIEPDRDLPPRKKKKEKEVTIDICGKEKRLSRKQTFLKEEYGFQLF